MNASPTSSTGVSEAAVARRLAELRALLAARGLDAALISDPYDVRRLSGWRGVGDAEEDAVLVVGADLAVICSYAFNAAQVRAETRGFSFAAEGYGIDFVCSALTVVQRELGDGCALGLQGGGGMRFPFSRGMVNHHDWRRIRRLHKGPLRDLGDALMLLRCVKDEEETGHLERASRIEDEALALTVADGLEGFTAAQLAWRYRTYAREFGAEDSFAIFQAGADAALPHAASTERRIGRGELVLIEVGSSSMGYWSELGRMFVIGEPSARQREVCEVVLRAQLAGIAAIREGVTAGDADAAARAVIAEAGHGEHQTHGLGHGIGLQGHEVPPHYRPSSDDLLLAGMTGTIEPGVYYEGELGARIDDLIVVTADGCRQLTAYPKEALFVVD